MIIAGVDEAGRGPAIGPMVLAVACIEKIHEEQLVEIGVKDSKVLTPKERERQRPEIEKTLKEFCFAFVQASEIDDLRIRKSLNEIEAMKIGEMLNKLKNKPEIVYVDAPDIIEENFTRRIRKYLTFKPIIKSEHKADVNYPIVSAASILAKTERDLEIVKLEKVHGKIGTGYPHDPITIEFIHKWVEKNGELPNFARKSWQTNIDIMDKRLQKKLAEC